MATAAKPAVYVVDDDPDVLGSLRFLLETDGFDVRTFRTGAALLRVDCAANAACFVIDYKMPDMNGVDLTNCLRNSGVAAPVIIITGYPDENILTRAKTAGIRHVVRKPLLEDSLVACVRAAISDDGADFLPS